MSVNELATNRARTKIVATVGPACRGEEALRDLAKRGVDVFRINTAHGQRSEHQQVLVEIRRLSQECRPLGVLVDLHGPKIRLGQLFQDPTPCPADALFRFVSGERAQAADELVSNYPTLAAELAVGGWVMLADGTVSMRVIEKRSDCVVCRVVGAGSVRSRQGINLPGAALSVPALTDADRDHAVWAARAGADFISLSFVRSAGDMLQLKSLLREHGSRALAIAKIEKAEAVEAAEEIIGASDGVMVARGDLGVEIDVARTAVVQKQIIAICQRLGKPVIVATQMLDSMQRSPRPTRAEVSDVANAILDGADACMLSGETAIGEYPRESVEMMNRVMLATEELLRDRPLLHAGLVANDVHPVTTAVVHGALCVAAELKTKLLVIVSRSGATARIAAKERGFIPAIGVSNSEEALRHMTLYWGITPLVGAPIHDPVQLRRFIDTWAKGEGLAVPGDRVVFVTGQDIVAGVHNLVEVHEVG